MHAPTKRRSRPVRTLLAAAIAIVAALPFAGATTAQTGCPTWSPGGSLIYCASSGSSTELFESSPDGTVRQLTFVGGQAASPSLSPDGSMIAFEVAFEGSPEPQIFLVDRFGPRSRTVIVGTTVLEVPVRPELKTEVLVGGTIIPLDLARAQRLTHRGSNFEPVFSLGGDTVNFTSDRDGSLSLWSMTIDGSDQHPMLVASID
jgi:Tol biopolymer transport system component